MRERHQNVNRAQNILDHPIGGIEVVRRNEFPNFVKINLGLGVKIVPGHEGSARRATLFARRRSITSSPLMGFTLPLLRSS
jgi:hypothetical protein